MKIDKVYISGALMAAQNLDRVKELYNDIAIVCIENGLYPYLPHNNTDPVKNSDFSDKEVYFKDVKELINSSLVIAYIGEPSLGVGAELSICIEKKIPIITVTESKQKVSRFMKGMLQTTENVISIEFENKEDLKHKLGHYLLSFCNGSFGSLFPKHQFPNFALSNK